MYLKFIMISHSVAANEKSFLLLSKSFNSKNDLSNIEKLSIYNNLFDFNKKNF